MELRKITRANAPTEEAGEGELWLTDVRDYGDEVGFEILDGDQTPIAQFLYDTQQQAEIGRERMFGVLENVVAVTTIDGQ